MGKGKHTGKTLYSYTVACVGVRHTDKIEVILRGSDRQHNAEAIAKQHHTGYIAYKTLRTEVAQ